MARQAKSSSKSKPSRSFNPHMTVGNFKKHRSLYTTVAKEVDVDATDEEIAACKAALEIFTRDAGIPIDVDNDHFNASYDFSELEPGSLDDEEVEIVNTANEMAIACLDRCGIPHDRKSDGGQNWDDMISKWKLKTGQARPASARRRKSDESERIDRLENGMGEILSLLKNK